MTRFPAFSSLILLPTACGRVEECDFHFYSTVALQFLLFETKPSRRILVFKNLKGTLAF